MKKFVITLVSRIEGRLSVLEVFIRSLDPCSTERAFISGRISAFRSVLTIINRLYHER